MEDSKLKAFEDLIVGTASDEKIAELAGVPVEDVVAARLRVAAEAAAEAEPEKPAEKPKRSRAKKDPEPKPAEAAAKPEAAAPAEVAKTEKPKPAPLAGVVRVKKTITIAGPNRRSLALRRADVYSGDMAQWLGKYHPQLIEPFER